ncbi:metallophosphoesterase family protein [uncultured Sphingomonas sp.]|uniref:metallophosphoesterase family protein n=1 Tax=uncultured Sphingomonas sp. TaxID=158754 RepID=UPI0025F346F9|nr:metallophosphoesterase family protein [uncultured Sphingomonas sp.]
MTMNDVPPQPPGPADAIHYAVGDVHGCYALLTDLLQQIVADLGTQPDGAPAELVFLGDYVDRGPASADVLSSLVWMERNSPLTTIFLKGNHEQVMLDYLADPLRYHVWLGFGGAETLRSYGIDVPDDVGPGADHVGLRNALLDAMPAAHLDFVQRLRLYHETERHIFVHAGIRPRVKMAMQDPADLLWIRKGFLDHARPAHKRVVHGHTWDDAEPVVRPERIGVDTGAYETGVLTAARLRGDAVAFLRAREAATG